MANQVNQTAEDLIVANHARVLCRVVLDRRSRDFLNLPRVDFSRVFQTALTTREAEAAAQDNLGLRVVLFDPSGRRYSDVRLRDFDNKYRFEGSDWVTMLGRNRMAEGSRLTLWWSREEFPGSNWRSRLQVYVCVAARNATEEVDRCRCEDCGKDLNL